VNERYFLPQSTRVKKAEHFSHLFKQGKRLEGSYIRIVTAPSLFDYSAVAFVTSKKIGKAVYRNKVKRRIKEIIRLNKHQIRQTQDYVFIAKPWITKASYNKIESEIVSLLEKNNYGK
jgi:ribonuclease P protein component